MQVTTNYNLKKPEGNDYAKIASINENADIIDQQLKVNADKIAALSIFQNATVVGSQLQLTNPSGSSVIKFKLNSNITGPITISLDGGKTSKPLKDLDGVQLTELEKGFVEVIADATFFTLRNRGGGLSNAELTQVREDINALVEL